MTQLTNKAAISLRGNNCSEFLQGQLTCDTTKITAQTWGFFGYCNYQGKVKASGYIFCQQKDHWLLVIDKSLVNETVLNLKKIAILSQIEVSQSELFPTTTSSPKSDTAKIAKKSCYLQLTNQLSSINIDIEQQFYLAELNAKIPTINIYTSSKFTPQNLGLDQTIINNPALSFTKGCYVGQEIVSRIYHKGHNKKSFYLATTNNTAQIKLPQIIYNQQDQAHGYIFQTIENNSTIGCILPIKHNNSSYYWLNNAQKIAIELKPIADKVCNE